MRESRIFFNGSVAETYFYVNLRNLNFPPAPLHPHMCMDHLLLSNVIEVTIKKKVTCSKT